MTAGIATIPSLMKKVAVSSQIASWYLYWILYWVWHSIYTGYCTRYGIVFVLDTVLGMA